MKIGTCVSAKGKARRGKLKVARLPNGADVEIPIKIAEGKKPGKTMFVCAGVHGDEINGIHLLKRFTEELDLSKISGTIVILPVINVEGYREKNRLVPYDNKDLNRAFTENGDDFTVSNQIAMTLMEKIIKPCDFGIDLHDYGQGNVLTPHVRIHKTKKAVETRELGLLFGTDILKKRIGSDGMLAVEALRKLKTPIITVEVGGGMLVFDEFEKPAMQGLKNILVHNGMMQGTIVLPKKQFILSEGQGIKAPMDGVFIGKVKLGDFVSKGDLIGVIYDPLTGKTDKIRANEDSFVFSLRLKSKTGKGEEVCVLVHYNKKTKESNAEIVWNEPVLGKTITKDGLFSRTLGFRT